MTEKSFIMHYKMSILMSPLAITGLLLRMLPTLAMLGMSISTTAMTIGTIRRIVITCGVCGAESKDV